MPIIMDRAGRFILDGCRSTFRPCNAALTQEGLDGWLLYDFQGNNPVATRLAGLRVCREADDPAVVLLHPGDRRAARAGARDRALQPGCGCPGRSGLTPAASSSPPGSKRLLDGARGGWRWNTPPPTRFPYVSRVDAGTVEAVRALGAEVVSSGDLIQRFEAVWTDEAYATHLAASDKLYRVKDQAFELIRERIRSATPTTEFEVQQRDGRVVHGGGAGHRRPAQRLGAGERRQSPLQPHSRAAAGRSTPASWC